MKLIRASSRLAALLMLAMLSSAVYYSGLASQVHTLTHIAARAWTNQPTYMDEDRIIFEKFQREFVRCVPDVVIDTSARKLYPHSSGKEVWISAVRYDVDEVQRTKGMGLDARPMNECEVKLVFTDESAAMWRDPKAGELEGLVYEFDLCRMITLWEQVRNNTTILTKEYIDGLPNGWRDYAWKRINKGHSKMCSNATLCKEKLALVLPSSPPFIPRQHGRCAVVGNSGDLLQDLFGAEIDAYDAVIRMNGAPVENYTHFVGEKTTFRILNRGSAKALDKVAALSGAFTLAASAKEILIIKTTIHDIMSRMIREVPIRNPVYLMVGAPLGRSAKGTGIKAIEFALSVCKQVDIYGFTVDPGYLGWTRYFSDARKGHAPLQGRAYYQTMECLGLIRVHSPQRRVSASTQHVKLNSTARNAAAHLSMPNKSGIGDGPLDACTLSVQGAKSWLNTSKSSQDHKRAVDSVRQYALDQAFAGGILCIKG